jgi:hypothetical protein
MLTWNGGSPTVTSPASVGGKLRRARAAERTAEELDRADRVDLAGAATTAW